MNEAQARYAAETSAGSADVRAATAFLRLGPVHERFLRLKFYFTSAVEPHADKLSPHYPFPLARQDGDDGEGTSGYGPMGGGGRGAGSLASQLQGIATGAAAAITPEATSGDASSVVGGPGSDAGGLRRNSGASAAAAGLPPRPGAGARLDPLGHPAGPGPGVLSGSAPGSAPGPAPSVAAADAPGTSQRRRRPRGASSGHHLHRRFPTPRRAPQRRPHGRSTRR